MLAVSRQAPTRCRDTHCGDFEGTDDVAKALGRVGTLSGRLSAPTRPTESIVSKAHKAVRSDHGTLAICGSGARIRTRYLQQTSRTGISVYLMAMPPADHKGSVEVFGGPIPNGGRGVELRRALMTWRGAPEGNGGGLGEECESMWRPAP